MQADAILKQVIPSLGEGAQPRLPLIERCMDAVILVAAAIQRCFQHGGKVLLFGNGGSAADA